MLRAMFGGTERLFPPKCIENTFKAIRSTFRSLEMHSRRRYKICICSVVLGQLESFRNYKRVSMGLTDRRKTAKKLVDSRKN